MKPLKLSSAAEQHLLDLIIVPIDRVQPATEELVKHGLARSGAGKWGTWVKPTETGRALVESWSTAKRDAVNRLAGATPGPPIERRETPVKVEVNPSESAAKRPAVPASRARPSMSTPPTRSGAAVPSGSQRKSGAAAESTPNALRVTLGHRVTYYPLTAAKSIKHGTIEYVVTSNKFFRSYPVAASAGDHTVLSR